MWRMSISIGAEVQKKHRSSILRLGPHALMIDTVTTKKKGEKNKNLPAHSRLAAAVSKLVPLALRRNSGLSCHSAQTISHSSRLIGFLDVS